MSAVRKKDRTATTEKTKKPYFSESSTVTEINTQPAKAGNAKLIVVNTPAKIIITTDIAPQTPQKAIFDALATGNQITAHALTTTVCTHQRRTHITTVAVVAITSLHIWIISAISTSTLVHRLI